MINDLCRQQPPPLARPPRAFTILELLISTAVITIVVIGVGYIFQSSSTAAGTSQALLEQMGDTRAIQRLLRNDLAGIDKRSFLIIRSRMLDPSNPASPRFDQIAFLAYGSFPNRTGADDLNNPFLDQTVANAAHIWWGQLVMEKLDPPDNSYSRSDQNEKGWIWGHRATPTGLIFQGDRWISKEDEFVLGRHTTLLVPGPISDGGTIAPAGRPLKAYRNINLDTPPIQGAGESKPARINASRFAVAGILPHQIPAINHSQADLYCYRFKALASVYDSEVPENPFVNGSFRMHPIVAPGVSSFKIDWTDGTTDDGGQLVWFGPTHFKGDNDIEFVTSETHVGSLEDHYRVAFNRSHPDLWPKALRFSYHIADPQHRLPGGRDYVEVIRLPD